MTLRPEKVKQGQCRAHPRDPIWTHVLECDKPHGHLGEHRGYVSATDEVLFWDEHATLKTKEKSI